MSINKNKVVKRKTVFFNLSSGSIKIVSILLGIVILILIGQGVYYLKLRRDLEIREEPRAPQVTPPEVDEEIIATPIAEMYFEGPEFYMLTGNGKQLLSIEGKITNITDQEIIISRASESVTISKSDIKKIYEVSFEEGTNNEETVRQESSHKDFVRGSFVSFIPDSGILTINKTMIEAEAW